MSYRILIVTEECMGWHDLGEGPWDGEDDEHDAIQFARNEVGYPYIVVDDEGTPVAYGSEIPSTPGRVEALHWRRPTCPMCGSHKAEETGGRRYCLDCSCEYGA